jgi:hypothetical protein
MGTFHEPNCGNSITTKKYVLCANTFVKTLLILNLYVDGVCSISGTGFWFAQNEQLNQFQFETGLY